MPLFLALIVCVCLFLAASPVNAQEFYECGTPDEVIVPAGVKDYCDIYTRRIEYHKQRTKLRASIDERRENYVHGRNQALVNYRQNLHSYQAGFSGPQEPVDEGWSEESSIEAGWNETAGADAELDSVLERTMDE